MIEEIGKERIKMETIKRCLTNLSWKNILRVIILLLIYL